MNSKKLGLLVILLALFAILFVSCNSEVTDATRATNVGNELVYATFDNNSKGIVVNTIAGYKSYDDLYWFYTATKTDSFGTTGQTSDLLPVRVVDSVPAKGLSGRVGPFSQGSWSFTLYAYDTAEKTNLYYQGSTSPDVTLRNGVENYIPVTVTPQGDYGYIAFYNGNTTDTYFEWKDNKGGNGALRLDITLKDSNNVVYNCVSKSLTKGTDNKYKIDGRIWKTATDDKFAAGVYTATFKVVNPSDSSVVFTSQDLSLRVYGNLETQLKGSLTEIVDAYGYFQVPEQQINVFIATAEAVTQTVNVAPEKYSSSQAQQTTTVKFEAAALDTTNSQHTLKVEVTPIATAATKFDVIGDETAVAGIDFELKKIVTTTVGDVTTTTEQTVETFENQKYATIETYIAKGFNTVTVVYTGTALAQPIANELATPTNVAAVYDNDSAMGTHLGYSKASGLLRFKTNHFSEYYVKASVEAINVTTNTVYTTLADAVAAVKNDETIQLIKDVTISDKLIVGSDTDAKNFVLDLNEKTLTGRTNLVHGNLTIKNGTIAGGDKQALNVYGSSSSASDYSVLTVESDVTVTADVYAVCLFGKTYDINGYGAVVNFYGKAITTGDTKNGAIFVSGNLGKNEGLANQNNVINIYGSVTSTTDAALALCGNALVNIYDGAELSGDTAVAVKRGKLVVVGGSIHSTGEKHYPPAANNNGTEMSGAGVSVTSTYSSNGPLAVEISGGLITSANADAVYRAAQTYAKDATVSITGGTFSSDPSVVNVTATQEDDYVAAGYESKKITIDNVDFWTVVKKDRTDESVAAVIKADDSVLYFSTLADAVDAAKQGETVKLLKDGIAYGETPKTSGVFYDLNGHVFTDCPETTYNGSLPAVGNFAGGAGTKDNPYLISEFVMLLNVDAVSTGSETLYYRVIEDLEAYETSEWCCGDLYQDSATYVVDLGGHSLTVKDKYIFGYAVNLEMYNGTVVFDGNGRVSIVGYASHQNMDSYNINFHDLVLTGTAKTSQAHYGPLVAYAFGLNSGNSTFKASNIVNNLEINNDNSQGYSGGLFGYVQGSAVSSEIKDCTFNGSIVSAFAGAFLNPCSAPKAGVTSTGNKLNGQLIASQTAIAFGCNGNITGGASALAVLQASVALGENAQLIVVTAADDLISIDGNQQVILSRKDGVSSYRVAITFNVDLADGSSGGYPRYITVDLDQFVDSTKATGIYRYQIVQESSDGSTEETIVTDGNGYKIWLVDGVYHIWCPDYKVSNRNATIWAYGYDSNKTITTYQKIGYSY